VKIAGIIVFGVLIYGGIRYLTSVGSPSAIADAKDQIFSAFLGLIILLFSYLILNTLNPQLITLIVERKSTCNCELPPEQWPEECKEFCRELKNPFKNEGVYLAKIEKEPEEMEIAKDYIWIDGRSYANLDVFGFEDKVKKIKFVNPNIDEAGYRYGAILYEHPDFNNNKGGPCRIFLSLSHYGEDPWEDVQGKDNYGKVEGVSSVTVFKQNRGDYKIDVELCEEPAPTDKCKSFNNIISPPKPLKDFGLEKKVRSIKIHTNSLVVLFEGLTGKCQAFTRDSYGINDLSKVPIGQCEPIPFWHFFRGWTPCATHVAIYPLK